MQENRLASDINSGGHRNAANLPTCHLPVYYRHLVIEWIPAVSPEPGGLADLYAVGVVGAIATNLGATATDRKLSIKTWERTLMFATFIVMAAIEMSLLIDKPNARYFAVTILAVGLILRGLVQERRAKKEAIPLPALAPEKLPVDVAPAVPNEEPVA